MGLRNLRKYIVKMNWKAALGEVVLIFVGVVAALYFENWNEERKERKDELEILSELREDFSFNERELTTKIRQLQELEDVADEILAHSGYNGTELTLYEADSLISEVVQLHTFDSRESAVRSVINSGRLHIISDLELRMALSEWEVVLAEAVEEVPLAQQVLHQQLFPYLNRWVSWAKIHRTMESRVVTDHDHRPVFRELEFENLIWVFRRDISYLRTEYVPLKEMIGTILANLDRSIKDLAGSL